MEWKGSRRKRNGKVRGKTKIVDLKIWKNYKGYKIIMQQPTNIGLDLFNFQLISS